MRSAAIILLVALIKVPVLPVPISGVNPECFLDYIQAYELSPALLLALASEVPLGQRNSLY